MRPFGNFYKRQRWSTASEMDMSIFLFNGFLLLGWVVATIPDVLVLGSPSVTQMVDGGTGTKKCRHKLDHNMLAAKCSQLELRDIPSLKTDIEVLDARVNRLRELTANTLSPYKSLAFIYLADNFIQTIEESAFANQQYLQVLDLSKNGCDNLPKSLFKLPYLRTLYLESNKLTDSVFNTEITSPINTLILAENKLTKIPDIGAQPSLMNLNLTENFIVRITTEDLASFCSLKVLDLSKNPIRFDTNTCDCQATNAWLKLRRIEMKPKWFNCSIESLGDTQCANVQFNNRTYELYDTCMTIIQQKEETEKARSVWILVASCVSVFLFCIFIILFCFHKRNRRRRRKQKEQQQLAATNANTELLNSNLTSNS